MTNQRDQRKEVKPHSAHFGENEVRVGPYKIFAGGMQYLSREDFTRFYLLIPLMQDLRLPLTFGNQHRIFAGSLQDFGGVPQNWSWFLEKVVAHLKSMAENGANEKALTFCHAGHGRTGTFLASLIALLESERETPDPIAAVRSRHCEHAVETLEQAEAIFALRSKALPRKYFNEFNRAPRRSAKGRTK